jgi:paraquat-inducible protein B
MMTTAQPEIRKDRAFNPIWLIPVIAVVLGVWMVVHSWMTEGPEIQIAFNTAEGLTAGKTKIKYRNVVMGLVQEVILTDDLQGVIAKVKLERQALPMLRDDTRFWVVTARISLGNVSGLDTLLSGAYIELSPGDGKVGQRKFTALEKPPLTPDNAPGLRLKLYSDKADSVSAGDVVLYKGYRVGRVESLDFDADRRQARYVIFIDAPFHELINSSVRFWNISGISVSAGADGFKITTGSMDTVLLGGVTFGIPPGIPEGDPVQHNAEFTLYENYEEILKHPYSKGTYFVVAFSQSIKGLLPNAPVEYRGIPVGRVKRILMKELMEAGADPSLEGSGLAIPVLIYLEPGRMSLPDVDSSVQALRRSISLGVQNGMRATLASGSLLTGAKYINIDYFPEQEELEVGQWQEYTTIPTIGTGLDQIEVKVNELLDKFNEMPLEDTVANANAAIVELDKTLSALTVILEDQGTLALPGELNATLRELRATLNGLTPDSPLYQNVNATLLQLNRTLSNVESLTRTLSAQPNAAVMPSRLPQDVIPEARR